MSNNPHEAEQTYYEVDEVTVDEQSVIIYNDDFNTFEHVIATLIKVCKHNNEQADDHHCRAEALCKNTFILELGLQ